MNDDLIALEEAVRALMKCTSRRMLLACLEYIQDTFIDHPPKDLPVHLLPEWMKKRLQAENFVEADVVE